jgi:UDP-arabinose 4-epimerase
MKRVLVTGGAGYIGSHTCKRLAALGYRPIVFDNLGTGHPDNVRWGPLWKGDVRNVRALEACIAAHRPEAVIHFAASAYVGESMAQPGMYYDNNVNGMISLLAALRGTELPVVFSSSCATYGVPAALPIREDTPQQPINPYGYSKLVGERMLADHARAHGLRYVALRYFNAAGADPDGELVERHDPETHLIPRALMAAAGTIPALEIFGDDYETPDGTCLRDYVHVSDLANAHVLALRHLERGGDSLCANVGTGKPSSVRELLAAIEAVTGFAVPHRFAGRRPGDPAELAADPTCARDVLGFVAESSDLATIVATAAPGFGLSLSRAA